MSTTTKKTRDVLFDRYINPFLKAIQKNPKSAWFLKIHARKGRLTGYTIQEDGPIDEIE